MNGIFARLICVVFFCGFIATNALAKSDAKILNGEWRSYGGDPGGMRYSPLEQINRSNISRLRRAWTYHTGELELIDPESGSRKPPFESTPLLVNGVLYFSTPSARVIALDAQTGKEMWKFDPQAGRTRRRFDAHRGVAYWEGQSVEGPNNRIFSGTAQGQLICLDAATGKLCRDFGQQGMLDLRRGVADQWPDADYSVTSPPAIYADLVITGASVPEGPSKGPSGDVRAFDVRTGRLVWRFHTVPRPGETGSDTWEGDSWKDRSGTNVWSIFSVDPERGLVFLPIGSPSYDFYGADRKGKNWFGNSLVALDASSGRLRWNYQMVHHDIWDYDLPAHPNLISIEREGRRIDAVAQVTKMGFVFVLDRLTGEPIFPVKERPVPQSKVPGEATWPTQPFPVKPPPLARYEPITRDDLNTLTPELAEFCTNFFESAAVSGGVYEPAGLDLTLSFPGTLGGATWSGASFDPVSGYLYVNVNEIGRIARMEPAKGKGRGYRRNSPWGAYARFWSEAEVPCQKPPWGTLNAIDLKTGDIAWKVPLGTIEEMQTGGATGTPNLGGSIVTAGEVVFIGGSNDRRLRAFDARNGSELWVGQLEASGHATPMTYLGKDGRQYVVIAAGGGGYFSQDKAADVIAAYALETETQ